jgi:streptogramin lyase
MASLVAVDGAGDVFIADFGKHRVVKVTPGGTQTTVVSGSGSSLLYGVAVDAAGDIFIADVLNRLVVKVTPDGTQTTVVSGSSFQPYGVAVDAAGDVFITDIGNNRVVEVQRSQAPTLTFAATLRGNTSSDSPQSITVENSGNAPLSALSPGLSLSPNFAQVSGSGTPADCSSSFALAPGVSCNLSLSFTHHGRSDHRFGGADRQRAERQSEPANHSLKGHGH